MAVKIVTQPDVMLMSEYATEKRQDATQLLDLILVNGKAAWNPCCHAPPLAVAQRPIGSSGRSAPGLADLWIALGRWPPPL